MAAQVQQHQDQLNKKDKSHAYGEINPFDPKINVIVLNGDILPTVSSVYVPGLRPRRKIASLPGRFVTLPIPDHLEGDFLPPDDMNAGTMTIGGLDENGVSPRNGVATSRYSPLGVSPRNGFHSPRNVQRLSSPREGSPRAPTVPGSPTRKLASPRHVPNPNSITIAGKKVSPRASQPNTDSQTPTFPVADGNKDDADAESKNDEISPVPSKLNKMNLQISTESVGEVASLNLPSHSPQHANSLEELVAEKIEYITDAYSSMFHLYAWANMSDMERKTCKDRPTVTYEETVTLIRDMVNWTEFASKKKYQQSIPEEKDVIRPLYMKILTLLMVHASIATGCDMNEVMHWHGHNVGYRIGKYIWTLVDLQAAVDDDLHA